MSTWIALFRGINIGGKSVLPMKALVRDLESLDLKGVTTYIQSGNAVFRSSRKLSKSFADRIAEKIETRHGFRPEVLLLGAKQLQKAIASNPFPEAEAEPKTLHLFFLAKAPKKPDTNSLKEVKSPSEQFKLVGDIFYLHTPDGFGRSKLAAKAEKLLGVAATARNWRTVGKLWEMVEAKRR